jgi:hypothetical protein
LFVNSGFTEPFPAVEPAFLYALSFALPVAAYAFTFAIAALAGTRGTVMVSWLGGGLGAAAIMGAGFLAEGLMWEGHLNGYISCPALLAAAPLALLAAYTRYQYKEGVGRPAYAPASSGGRLIWVIVALVVALILFFGLFVSVSRGRGTTAHRNLRMMDTKVPEQQDSQAAPMPVPPSSGATPPEEKQ